MCDAFEVWTDIVLATRRRRILTVYNLVKLLTRAGVSRLGSKSEEVHLAPETDLKRARKKVT